MILGLADGDAARVGANAEILREWRSPSASPGRTGHLAATRRTGYWDKFGLRASSPLRPLPLRPRSSKGSRRTAWSRRRELIEALERGSTKPRSHELRTLEIGLHTAVYAETYLKEQ